MKTLIDFEDSLLTEIEMNQIHGGQMSTESSDFDDFGGGSFGGGGAGGSW
ncbi:MAG TPA: hypothetical protein VFC65_13080 [Prolixibacteraceae bacterium]|nr:hypothetical protein [Prolixibacteraceae bacterium]